MGDQAQKKQDFGADPLNVRETNCYQKEYVQSFVEKWDELIDWDARAESEGQFFIDILKARGKTQILDVATGTGFHSVQLLKAGFDVTSADGNAEMLTKAFENTFSWINTHRRCLLLMKRTTSHIVTAFLCELHEIPYNA